MSGPVRKTTETLVYKRDDELGQQWSVSRAASELSRSIALIDWSKSLHGFILIPTSSVAYPLNELKEMVSFMDHLLEP